jgi:uncharacterized protein YcbK (DUF882 family)
MKYFTIEELCASNTAKLKKINNEPNKEIINNLTSLIEKILDPLREEYKNPIIINSGYRCPQLNKLVGGAKTSQHMTGLAADITVGNKNQNKKLFELAIKMDLPYDQIIDESNFSWVHISYSDNPRKQILHL